MEETYTITLTCGSIVRKVKKSELSKWITTLQFEGRTIKTIELEYDIIAIS